MNYEQFIDELNNIGIELDDYQLSQFKRYFQILVSENAKYNLTSIVEEEEVFFKHFYDCVAISQFFQFSSQSLCDIGSGAGFPAIPLKIIFPSLQITIVDALGKRIRFLEMLCDELELNSVECIHARAEDYAKVKRESFDIVCARAVANLQVLSELCIPLVKVSGHFLVLKGSNGVSESKDALNATEKLGCKLENSYNYELPFTFGSRTFFSYLKIKNTPSKFPRHFGKIKNKPL